MLRCLNFLFKCIEDCVVHPNIIEVGIPTECYCKVTNGRSGKNHYFALQWLGNFKPPGFVVGRPSGAGGGGEGASPRSFELSIQSGMSEP